MSSLFENTSHRVSTQRADNPKCNSCICQSLDQLANQSVVDLCHTRNQNHLLIKNKGSSQPMSIDGSGTPTVFTLEGFDPRNCCAVFSFEQLEGTSSIKKTFVEDCHNISGIACVEQTAAPPPLQKPLCCHVLIDHKTQLVPPARRGTATHTNTVETKIEKVCNGVVVVCGVVHKEITYTAVENGNEMPEHTIQDDIPFQCLIEGEDIKEDDRFQITEQDILCEISANEANFGGTNQSLAWKFVENEIIKVCIERVTG